MRTIIVLLMFSLFVAVVPVSADVNFGGLARVTAMGGAGLASTDNPSVTSTMNPAALGLMPKRIRLAFPSINLQTEGASLGDISSWASDISSLSGPEGIELAREFGKRDTLLDVSANAGLVGSPISITADAEARLRILPNAAFRQFAETGVVPADPSSMEAVIWSEAATSLPSISFGFKVPSLATGKGDLWIGTRLRWVQGDYIRRTVTWSEAEDQLVTSNEPSEKESGIGGDVGIIYRTPGPKNMTWGVVATNLIQPKLGKVDQETLISLGMAMQPNPKTLLVADLVNLTDAYDEGMKLRVGIEVKPIKQIALRAGYSGDSITTGIGVFGLDFAFSSDTPLTVARTVRF